MRFRVAYPDWRLVVLIFDFSFGVPRFTSLAPFPSRLLAFLYSYTLLSRPPTYAPLFGASPVTLVRFAFFRCFLFVWVRPLFLAQDIVRI